MLFPHDLEESEENPMMPLSEVALVCIGVGRLGTRGRTVLWKFTEVPETLEFGGYYYPTLPINRQASKILLRQGSQDSWVLQEDSDTETVCAAFFLFLQ